MFERQAFEPRGIDAWLRIDQLQILAAGLPQRRIGLGADADPVQARRRRQGSVGLHRDLETGGAPGGDQGVVEL
jgi:hypothetical protein